MSRKIPGAVFRWIEFELYSFEKHQEELQLLKEEILLQSPDRLSGGRTGTISDQTGNKAVKLAANPRIDNLENKISVIGEVLKRNEIFKEIYKYKYQQNCSMEECYKKFGGKRIFKFLREMLILQVAQGLGEFQRKQCY